MAAPSTPAGLSIDHIFSNGALVSWNSSAGATYYELWKSFDGVTYFLAHNIPGTDIFDGAPFETTVYYKVLAGNIDGESVLSSVVSDTTLARLSKKAFLTPKLFRPFDANAYFATSPSPGNNYGLFTDWKAWIGGDLQVDADISVDGSLTVGEYLYFPSEAGSHFRLYEDAYGINLQYYNGSSWITVWRIKDGGVQEGIWNVPASLTVNAGGTPVGTIAGVQGLNDASVYQLPEVAATPGFDVEFNFTGVNFFRAIAANFYYQGLSSHIVTLDLYNYNTTAWDSFILISSASTYSYRYIEIPDSTNYVDGSGNAKVRFYHSSAGNAAHNLYVDYLALKG